MLTYDTEPTPEEVSRLLVGLDGLYRDVRPDALRIKDALHDLHKAFRWKLARLNNTVPDAEGRVIAPKMRKAA